MPLSLAKINLKHGCAYINANAFTNFSLDLFLKVKEWSKLSENFYSCYLIPIFKGKSTTSSLVYVTFQESDK